MMRKVAIARKGNKVWVEFGAYGNSPSRSYTYRADNIRWFKKPAVYDPASKVLKPTKKYFNKHPFNNDSLHFLKRNGFVEEANIKSENWSYKITIKGKNELVKSFRTKIGFYLSIFAIVLSIIAIIVSIIALI